MEFKSYLLTNPNEVNKLVVSAQINVFEHTPVSSLIVTYELTGCSAVSESGIAKGLRGCKNIFTRDLGKAAIWELQE